MPRSAKAVQVRGGVQGEKPLLSRVYRDWRAGSRQALRFDWTPAAPGRYTLFIEIDPANRADLRVSRVKISPSHPCARQEYRIRV